MPNYLSLPLCVCVCVCVRACVRAFVRASERASVRACVRACVQFNLLIDVRCTDAIALASREKRA